MATVVLFHSALGRRPALLRFADLLRDDGHEVVTPDLFAGAVFDDLLAGASARDEIGIPALVERAFAAVEGLPPGLVYAGFSMGTMPALLLAATRPGARGALLFEGAAPLEALDVAAWPPGVPIQVHTSRQDPWVDGAAVGALWAGVPAGLWEHHEYPGQGHLVCDDGWRDHDPETAQAMAANARTWLRRVGSPAAAHPS